MISILILSKNEEQTIGKCLSRIEKQEIDEKFEIVCIDSGSTDKTLDKIRNTSARLIEIPLNEFHHGKTRNLGVKHSKGDKIVFITADAIPASKFWLKNLIKPLKLKSNVGGVYGRQITIHNSPIIRNHMSTLYCEKGYEVSRKSDLNISNTRFSNVNSVIRKSIWEVNKFSENIWQVEDQFWAIRSIKLGYTIVYNPKAAVFHSHNYKKLELIQRAYELGVMYRLMFDKFRLNPSNDFIQFYKDWVLQLSDNKPFLEKIRLILENIEFKTLQAIGFCVGWEFRKYIKFFDSFFRLKKE